MGFWTLISRAERIAMLIVILGKASYAMAPVVEKVARKYRRSKDGKDERTTIKQRYRARGR